MYGGRRFAYLLIVLVASRVGWYAYGLVFRQYGGGGGGSPTLLNTSPEAAAAAGIAWFVVTLVLVLPGFLLVHRLGG